MTIKVTRRQLELLIKEATAPGTETVLTEAELNEISALLTTLTRSLGSLAAKGFSKILDKGVEAVGDWMKQNPDKVGNILAMIKQTQDKLPGVKKLADEIELDKADPKTVAIRLQQIAKNPPEDLKADMNKMFKQGAEQMEKAADCECPDPAKEQGIMGKIGNFLNLG